MKNVDMNRILAQKAELMNEIVYPIPKHPRIKLSPQKYKALCKLVDERDDGCCVICGKSGAADHHHIIFRSHMGSDTEENLVLLCHSCHMNKVHGDERTKGDKEIIVNRGKRIKQALWDYTHGSYCTEWRKANMGRISKVEGRKQ